MSRTSAREDAFKILFQMQFVKEDVEQSIRTYLESFGDEEIAPEDLAFIRQEVAGVTEHKETLDELISGALKGWSLYRLSKVDLSILRLSAYEIRYAADIPYSVTINEAVNLAKKFSQEQAPSFINGVLGAIEPCEKTAAE